MMPGFFWLSGLLLVFTYAAPLFGQTTGQNDRVAVAAASLFTHPLEALRTLDSDFPFQPPGIDDAPAAALDQWLQRRESLRRDVQISLGLWPLPGRTPLNAVIHGRREMDGYTIEKVYFESFPGFHVCGNLYRPAGASGRLPGVLSPHGHFADGRFHQASEEAIRRELQSGAESFESNARSPLQARCVHLARMGCVVFHYDMVGYADCRQISQELAHGFRAARPEMNGEDGWGFFSPQAELRLQSIMGLQTWNSIRSLDFLCSLPDVDPARIGVTGASGGGTQTFVLCAIDPRPAVAFPAVMVSTAMQGGCTCENCCNLRVDTGNVELAGLFAPKPLGLTAADDWTRDMATKGFPQLQWLYSLYYPDSAELPLSLTARLEFGHNYNQPSREAMYRFMNEHLNPGRDEDKLVEQAITVLKPDELTVYDELHPRPEWSVAHERRLLMAWDELGRIAALESRPLYDDSLRELDVIVRAGLASIVGHRGQAVHWRGDDSVEGSPPDNAMQIGALETDDAKLKFPVAMLRSLPASPDEGIEIRLTAQGSAALPDNHAESVSETKNTASIIVALDWLPGLDDGSGTRGNPLVANGREAAGYTFGYNRSLFAWRVSQVLYLIDWLEQQYPQRRISMSADRMSAPMAIVARALAARPVDLNCQVNGFRFAHVPSLRDEMFLPGAVKFGDVDAFLAVRRDSNVELTGESAESMPLVYGAWQLQPGRSTLRFSSEKP